MGEPTIEHKGLIFSSGLRYCIELTRLANTQEEKDYTIEEVLKHYLFDTIVFDLENKGTVKLMPEYFDRWQIALDLAHRMANDDAPFNVIEYGEQQGLENLVAIVSALAVKCSMTYTGKGKEQGTANDEKKKAQP